MASWQQYAINTEPSSSLVSLLKLSFSICVAGFECMNCWLDALGVNHRHNRNRREVNNDEAINWNTEFFILLLVFKLSKHFPRTKSLPLSFASQRKSSFDSLFSMSAKIPNRVTSPNRIQKKTDTKVSLLKILWDNNSFRDSIFLFGRFRLFYVDTKSREIDTNS